ncbi:MAG: DUF434 domain-containing protein [Thermodesulfobacteriota bacterium]
MIQIKEASTDFRYLLSRGYPRAAALALVGDRYHLDHTARQILHRGVFAPDAATSRRAKLRLLRDLGGQPLGIDGHNVLITLECAIRHLPLVAADDGWLRDVGQVSRAYRASPETGQALILLAEYLTQHQAGPVHVFYDAPLSLSGELARRTRELWAEKGLAVTAAAVPVPERELLALASPLASSDTALIDQGEIMVDLAGEIIRRQGWSVIELGP